MEANEMTMQSPSTEPVREKRVVEAEIRLPKLEEIKLREIDLTPVRKAAADVLLTGLGVGVLVGRGVVAAVKAAYQAGTSAAEKPGSVASTLVRAVRGPDQQASAAGAGIKMHVPVLPIEDYDKLNHEQIINKLEGLTAEQLAVLRDYEQTHANRSTVLKAIQARLA